MMITRFMPMRTIQVNGEDYLERYFVGKNARGDQDWLHRFLRPDSEPHLHSHPWHATSTILCGWYCEQVKKGDVVFSAEMHPGYENELYPGKLHRIIDVHKNTWTHMRVYAGREPIWFFIDDLGNKKIEQTSPENWFEKCGPRECHL